MLRRGYGRLMAPLKSLDTSARWQTFGRYGLETQGKGEGHIPDLFSDTSSIHEHTYCSISELVTTCSLCLLASALSCILKVNT